MPASDVVFPGGVTVKGNGYTGDVTSYVLELLQSGLWKQTIPSFDDYATLVAAFPSPTVLNTPPLCQVYASGDDTPLLYFFSPSAGAWTVLSRPDELRDGTATGTPGGASIVAPGDTLGVTSGLTLLTAVGSRRVHVDFAALVNFGAGGSDPVDIVDVVLRRDGTAVRSARVYGRVGSQASGAGGYTFNIAGGAAATTLAVVISKVGGSGGCTSTNNGLLTYLQADVTLL